MTSLKQTTRGLGDFGENLSIMIPNYNGSKYILETVRSLKALGDCISEAQIEVLDNCSTDNSEEVVRQFWDGRISFFRHPVNIGGIENFNACIARAERQWIHILHSDDFVLHGAYQEFNQCVVDERVSAVFARCVFADQDSFWTGVTPLLGIERQGFFKGDLRLWRHNPLQYAGIIVSKAAYEAVGEFDVNMPYVCDWDMWWRLSQTQTVSYTNACVAAYRMHGESSSSRLQRTGANIGQSIKLLHKIQKTEDARELHISTKETFAITFAMAIHQAACYLDDPKSFAANMKAIQNFPSAVQSKRQIIKLYARYWKRSSKAIIQRLISKRK